MPGYGSLATNASPGSLHVRRGIVALPMQFHRIFNILYAPTLYLNPCKTQFKSRIEVI